jgi:hypothetical protein
MEGMEERSVEEGVDEVGNNGKKEEIGEKKKKRRRRKRRIEEMLVRDN